MKKLVLTLLSLLTLATAVMAATTQDALDFFNRYVAAANTYNPIVATMYSSDARIIRQIVRPDGSLVTRETDTARYISEMKKGQAVAKLRQYKNSYSNITVTALSNDTFKVSSLRQPSGESYKLKAYMIVKQKPDGNWVIIEEMMQTKVQILINAK